MDVSSEVHESFVDIFHQDGIFVFKNLITSFHTQLMVEEIAKIHALVLQKIRFMDRPIRTYSDIAERHLGRLDYRCGFIANIFKQVEEPIIKLIQKLSPTIDFRHYWGAIPSLPGSGPTNMHRDVYPFLNTTQDVDLGSLDTAMPPYYFTVLLPLIQITTENGPTLFIKSSHRQLVDVAHQRIIAPLLSPGDVVIFDGRLMHAGSANNSKAERLIAYITFVANWYHDQTFSINDYLFPELTVKD